MTTRQTLMREPNSLLGRMFDIDSPLTPAAKDKVFLDIDRNTTYIFLMHKKGLLEVQYATRQLVPNQILIPYSNQTGNE